MKPQKRIFSLLFLLMVAMGQNLIAQSHSVSGKITDAQNRQPLAFVNVVVNEGLNGTMSDIDGRYEISSTEPIHRIKFSSVGYETQTIELQPNAKKCNIALKPITWMVMSGVIATIATIPKA